jgi:hypothetical protein
MEFGFGWCCSALDSCFGSSLEQMTHLGFLDNLRNAWFVLMMDLILLPFLPCARRETTCLLEILPSNTF